jgi:hypothetical protein
VLIELPHNKGKKVYSGKNIAIRRGKVIKADLCRPKKQKRWGMWVEGFSLLFVPYFCCP